MFETRRAVNFVIRDAMDFGDFRRDRADRIYELIDQGSPMRIHHRDFAYLGVALEAGGLGIQDQRILLHYQFGLS